MPRIHVLTDRVANQIAAGEVIERPAAVIKELVENAIDAGATRVEVEFSHGGRSFMRVEDNGHGMSREDALLALERHATSKILEADDLNRLISFGFRGEALPSIASVSKFTLQTRELGADLGTEIAVNGGKFVHVRECGRAVGTRIEVAQLFNSVPARRKFLKTDTTEAAHIIHAVRLYALAFPRVAFTLVEEGRQIFRSPSCSALPERVSTIFGRQLSDALMPLEAAEGGMRVSGLIGLPGQGRATRHEMITFINQRPVDSRTLNYALIESYHESLPKGRYPVAFVFFEISPAEVDVNVHPAKREVRFRSEPNVRSFVIRNILSRLRELTPAATLTNLPIGEPPGTPGMSVQPAAGSPAMPPSPAPLFTAAFASGAATHTWAPAAAAAPVPGDTLRSTIAPAAWPAPVVTLFPRDPAGQAHSGDASAQPVETAAQGLAAASGGSGAAPAADPVRNWRFLGLAHRHFALFETPGGLMLLDRRAVHERIWYERLQTSFARGQVPSQRLLLPIPIELDSIASALLLDAGKFLGQHGFEIREFGRNFFRVEAVPDWMKPSDAEPCVRDLLALLREGQLHAREINLGREELARFAATRGVRLPETVGETELRALLAELFASKSPLTSPGGRPTFVELSHGELGRRFGRG